MNYVETFVLNVLVLPATLLGLVALTWTSISQTGRCARDAHQEPVDADSAGYHDTKESKRSDYFFAVFLFYPTMTQTFFGHFNCRQVTEKMRVLEKDYSMECWEDPTWTILA
eukprot:COSAG06_NODE_27749_length_587_cov_0.793033_2_plen_111_part_01